MKRFLAGFACLAAACAGQGAAADVPTWPVAPAALALSSQAWNAGQAELGAIKAVVEDGDDVVVFGDHGATVFAGGAVSASDNSVTDWRSAARIPAADGSGYWAVGVANDGQLYRLRAGMALESISDRYGLLADSVLEVAPLEAPLVAFALDRSLVIADGQNVVRYDVAADRSVAGDAHRVAAVSTDGSLRMLDVTSHEQATLPVGDATASVFFQGKLLVQTPDALLLESETGELAPIHHASANLHGLAVSGERLWFLQGSELCTAEASKIECGGGDGIAATSEVFGSTSGDVWVLTAGALARFGVPAVGDEAVWRMGALSVYARVCSSCHAPGGPAGFDLSSYEQWQKNRDAIYTQVVVNKSMPPDRALADADRAAIAAWAMPAM
jgi:hypothetical protein